MRRSASTAVAAAILLTLSLFTIGLHAEDFFFDSNGVRIHYIVEGQGEPVVLIHGYMASIDLNWRAPGVIKALTEKYRVIALDNRGHGQSGKPHEAGQYGLKMTDDVINLMDHLKIDKAHIVGYSMGGFMTDKLLAEHPERFITATLGGAGWMKPDADPSMLEALAKSLEDGKGVGPLLLALNPKGVPPPSQEQIDQINKMLVAFADPLALAQVARQMSEFAVPESKLRANKVPVLDLVGENDPLKDGVDQLDGVMANLQIDVIPGATHMTAFANPKFIKDLKAFLANHTAVAVVPAAAAASR